MEYKCFFSHILHDIEGTIKWNCFICTKPILLLQFLAIKLPCNKGKAQSCNSITTPSNTVIIGWISSNSRVNRCHQKDLINSNLFHLWHYCRCVAFKMQLILTAFVDNYKNLVNCSLMGLHVYVIASPTSEALVTSSIYPSSYNPEKGYKKFSSCHKK